VASGKTHGTAASERGSGESGVEIRIIEDRPNPLLKRHEYRFEVAHATAATPSRDSVRGELSKLVKAPKDRVIIERMAARFGTATTRGDAMVYETADAAKSITREHILVRNGLKEKAAKGPAAATEAPATESPKPPSSAEPARPETPKGESPKEESPAAKEVHKAEHKAESKGEHKPEHKGDAKAEPHKGEHKPEPKTDEKPESHKGEHKTKAPKAEKDTAKDE
jgi:small subunit ribosomal protein S24e